MIFVQALLESLASSMYHSPPRVYLIYLAVGVVISIAWRRKQAEQGGAASSQPAATGLPG
jgi:hypothetical protein